MSPHSVRFEIVTRWHQKELYCFLCWVHFASVLILLLECRIQMWWTILSWKKILVVVWLIWHQWIVSDSKELFWGTHINDIFLNFPTFQRPFDTGETPSGDVLKANVCISMMNFIRHFYSHQIVMIMNFAKTTVIALSLLGSRQIKYLEYQWIT